MSNPEVPANPDNASPVPADHEIELASESADVAAIIGGSSTAEPSVPPTEDEVNPHYLLGSNTPETESVEAEAAPTLEPVAEVPAEPRTWVANAAPAPVEPEVEVEEPEVASHPHFAPLNEPEETTAGEPAAVEEAAASVPEKEELAEEVAPTSEKNEPEVSEPEKEAEDKQAEKTENPVAAAAKDDTLIQRRRLLSNVPTETEAKTSTPNWTPRMLPDTEKTPSKEELQSSIFEGATVVPTIPSRKAAHAWAFLIGLVMTPITWYLMSDAGARLIMREGQWDTLTVKPFTVLEVFAAAVCIIFLVISARWSSIGAFVSGVILFLVGIPFIAAPEFTSNFLAPVLSALKNFNAFGGNVAHHLVSDGSTGRFLFYGLTMILIGFVSHGARRKGRKDTLTYDQVNPAESASKKRGRRSKDK